MAESNVLKTALIIAIALCGSVNRSFGQPVASEEFFPGTIRLIVPPVVYAVPGIECNIYFDNIVLTVNSANYAFDVICSKGVLFRERWTYTPSKQEAGEYPIVVEVRDDANKLVARGQSMLRVAAESCIARPATLLIVGDSLTEYSVYPRHILNLSRQCGNSHLRFIGSRGSGNMPPTDDLRHEGYSGWTAQAFATLSGPLSRSGYHHRPATGSPFMYESPDGSKELDFARYCREFNDGRGPDLIAIGLGTNDVFTAMDDTIEKRIDGVIGYYDTLIQSMRKTGTETRIGLYLANPPSFSQDGFRGYTGPGRQTRWQYRRNQHRLVERMLHHYCGRAHEHIDLVPNCLNLDVVHGFPASPSAANARSDEQVMRVADGVHPSEAGYQQIGDVIYSWIVNMASEAK